MPPLWADVVGFVVGFVMGRALAAVSAGCRRSASACSSPGPGCTSPSTRLTPAEDVLRHGAAARWA